ncbi:MAG: hypothetical protein KatS3mg008_0494 [Acidimicrobiales bacterium]|nr:MAG: hypothetical protein KatS3mg008_0494 [Acidimicrobiales bacterium]
MAEAPGRTGGDHPVEDDEPGVVPSVDVMRRLAEVLDDGGAVRVEPKAVVAAGSPLPKRTR